MIRVLVVDDSRLVREVLRSTLSAQPGIEVVATAANPYEARQQIVRHKPDVITLDLEMPKMGGLTFLRKLMGSFPVPVVVLSAFGDEGSDAALHALELGAIDVVRKAVSPAELSRQTRTLAERIRLAASVRPDATHRISAAVPGAFDAGDSRRVVAIGASTGGTGALVELFTRFPANMPPVLVVQHMPEYFVARFADRLDGVSVLDVRLAVDGERLERGRAYVAPGGKHLRVERVDGALGVRVETGERINHCMPSVDALFHSIAGVGADGAVGVLLTGMGWDGADGLLALRAAGARTLAQDEASSVVWGMPGRAVEIGAAETIVSLENMPGAVLGALRTRMEEV